MFPSKAFHLVNDAQVFTFFVDRGLKHICICINAEWVP